MRESSGPPCTKIEQSALAYPSYVWYIPTMLTTSRDRRLYVTVRDPTGKPSKTVTVRGPRLTPTRLIRLLVDAVREQQQKRKAG